MVVVLSSVSSNCELFLSSLQLSEGYIGSDSIVRWDVTGLKWCVKSVHHSAWHTLKAESVPFS